MPDSERPIPGGGGDTGHATTAARRIFACVLTRAFDDDEGSRYVMNDSSDRVHLEEITRAHGLDEARAR